MPAKTQSKKAESEKAEPQTNGLTAYCLKCREKRTIADPEYTQLKNGRPAATGPCPECGTKIYRIGATP